MECGHSTCGRCGRLEKGPGGSRCVARHRGGFYLEGLRSQGGGGSIRCGRQGRDCGGVRGGRLSEEAVPVFQGAIAGARVRTTENRGLIQEARRGSVSAEGRKRRRRTAPFTKVFKNK